MRTLRSFAAAGFLVVMTAGCGSRDSEPASPVAPESAGVPIEVPAPEHREVADDHFVSGKIVVKIEAGYDLDDFNEAWGTTTDVLVEGTTFAQLDLPGEYADPREYLDDYQAWEGCELAELLYRTESPESQQGTVPFFESDATSETVTDQGAMDRIGAPAAHAVSTGAGVIVAIVDTGVDFTHPDLAPRQAPGGRDFVDDDLDPADVAVGLDSDGDLVPDEAAGHGTHVAGLVRAVAPGAQLLAVRVLDSEGAGTSVGVARGIRWAAAQGADVINLSLGMYHDSWVIKEAVHDAVDDFGVVIVAAAGNAGRDDRRHFPSRLSRVIGVAATDADDLKAPFSNYGSKVSLSAPGVGLVSTWLQQGYASWSGTSMATPLVSGAAALRLQRFPGTSPADMEDALQDAAQPLAEGHAWSGRMGAGLLQVVPILY